MLLRNVQIIERGENKIILRWDPISQTRQLFCEILRSDGRFGPFEVISPRIDLTKSSEYTDQPPTQHRYRRWYYKFQIIDEKGNVTIEPDRLPVSSEFRGDQVAVAMSGDVEIYLREYGREVIYLPVRTYGERCPVCYDKTSSKKLKSGCEVCWDTTFVNGYLTPVKTSVILEMENKAQTQDSGITGVMARARFPWYIDLRPGSILIENENTRWKVIEPFQTVSKRRVTIYQIANISAIPYGGIEWKIPVPDEIAKKPTGFRYS